MYTKKTLVLNKPTLKKRKCLHLSQGSNDYVKLRTYGWKAKILPSALFTFKYMTKKVHFISVCLAKQEVE